MHSLAIALHCSGWKVTGSDDRISEPSRSRLEEAGLLPPQEGWDPKRITRELDVVILGMHARRDNPELEKALALGLQVCSFPEFFYEMTKGKRRVVIGGSHGKTTVTSMILHVLRQAGIKCDYLVGAQLPGFDNMAALEQSRELAVFEGDEYLSSALDPRPKFHLYRPHLAVITGIAWDHVNVFPRYDDYLEQFEGFIRKIEPSGSLIYCREDRELSRMAEATRPDLEKVPYSTHPFVARDRTFFLKREQAADLPLQIFGSHNMQNIAAALEICRRLGIEEDIFYEAMASFKGAARRLQVLEEREDFSIYQDFAHAPSKVKATVRALRELHPERKLVACLELHTYSSLSVGFLSQYRGTLDEADQAVVYIDPAAARLKRLKPLSRKDIVEGFQREDLLVIETSRELEGWIDTLQMEGTDLVLMSSGNFGGIDLPGLALKK